MEIRITLGNHQLLLLTTFISIILALGIATAFNAGGSGGTPSVMGHSVDEMDWSNPIPSDLYVSGDVGLGMTAPDGRLVTVEKGTLGTNAAANKANSGLRIINSGDTASINFDSNQIESLSEMFINHGSANNVYIASGGGNVGIGTTTPGTSKLRVAGAGGIFAQGGDICTDQGAAACLSAAVEGSGTTNRVPKWTAGTTLGNSVIREAGGNIGIGVSPTAKLHIGGTPGVDGIRFPDGTLQTTAGFPSGVIVMWSGTLATIPAGWALCDGSSGTPDLRNRFVYGVSTAQNPGSTGGSSTHTHGMGNKEVMFGPDSGDISTGILGGLRFALSGGTLYAATAPTGNIVRMWWDEGILTGSDMIIDYLQTRSDAVTDSASTLPRYYKLAFIMKL